MPSPWAGARRSTTAVVSPHPCAVCPRKPVRSEIDRAPLEAWIPRLNPPPVCSTWWAHPDRGNGVRSLVPGPGAGGLEGGLIGIAWRRHPPQAAKLWRVSPFVAALCSQLSSPAATHQHGSALHPRAGSRRCQAAKSLAAVSSDGRPAGHLDPGELLWRPCARRPGLPVICIPGPLRPVKPTAPGEQWACRRGVFCFERLPPAQWPALRTPKALQELAGGKRRHAGAVSKPPHRLGSNCWRTCSEICSQSTLLVAAGNSTQPKKTGHEQQVGPRWRRPWKQLPPGAPPAANAPWCAAAPCPRSSPDDARRRASWGGTGAGPGRAGLSGTRDAAASSPAETGALPP